MIINQNAEKGIITCSSHSSERVAIVGASLDVPRIDYSEGARSSNLLKRITSEGVRLSTVTFVSIRRVNA